MPLDPLLQPIIDAMNAQPAPPTDVPPAELRERMNREMESGFVALGDDPVALPSVADHAVPVDGGEITVRVYTPEGAGPFPAHLYIHGGGFFMGTLDGFDALCRSIAAGAGCLVASVDYRLAPEYKFPTAPEDCYAALVWLAERAPDLNVDPARISVGGGSAGGNLAAVLALMTRDRNGPPLVFQVIEIPVTDMTASFPSITENGTGYMLTKESMDMFGSLYLADPADATNPYTSPYFADDLAGLPPALVVTAEFDPLRDEGEAYARRLEDAGVSTELVRMNGHFHGSMGFTKVLPSAVEHRERVNRVLRAAYGTEA